MYLNSIFDSEKRKTFRRHIIERRMPRLEVGEGMEEGEYTKHSWLPTLLIRISERALVILAHLVEEWAADRTRAKLALSS